MHIQSPLKALALATIFTAAAALAQTPYEEGQEALREQRWMDAAEQFEAAIEQGGEQADAAMYWRAHALYRASRGNEAERQISALERGYPDSQWVKEARILQIEHQDSADAIAREAADGSGLDDELRLFALAQLMERNPERALPLVLEMVHNTDSERVRRDALFVLGMSEDPAARAALADIVRNSGDTETRVQAIHILGAAGGESTLDLLWSLYDDASDIEVKSAVAHALTVAGDTEKLKQILVRETDPELREIALFGIATQDDPESAALMASMYEQAASAEEKGRILQALSVMGDSTELAMKILREESDPELQVQAIQVLGIMGATGELSGLYRELDSREARSAVLESMAIAGDTDGLLAILASEEDAQLRAAAIQSLAISGDGKAGAQLASLYENAGPEEKRAVIQAMMIMDDSEQLLALLKQEDDPEMQREILQMLTLMDSEAADEYLFELLEKEG
jgi:HEAT repeat protein